MPTLKKISNSIKNAISKIRKKVKDKSVVALIGLKLGDVITHFNKKKIKGVNDLM